MYQKISAKLNAVLKTQDDLKDMLVEQSHNRDAEIRVGKGKGKRKGKFTDEFYQVNIYYLCFFTLFSLYSLIIT
jgi:hypothetical protein